MEGIAVKGTSFFEKIFITTLSFIWLLLAACSTTSKDDDQDGLTRTHYLLEVGEKIPHPAPLPTETKIVVQWHLKNGETRRVEGFKGWDFNRDGRFEMVDVLNEDGTLQSRAFDFDGDGTIDGTEN
jgi:hypothetical protein